MNGGVLFIFYIEGAEDTDKNLCLNPQVKSQAMTVVSRQRWQQVRNYKKKNSLWSWGPPTKKTGVCQSSKAWMREGAWADVGASHVISSPFLGSPL